MSTSTIEEPKGYTTGALKTAPPKEGRNPIPALVGVGVSILIAILVLVAPLPREVLGLLAILNVITLIVSGVHIGIAMLVAGGVGLISLGGWKMIDGTLEQLIFNAVASWQLSVIPMFVLMGIIMWKGGLTGGAFEAARQWLGRLPGGLAVATNFAGAGLAASSGSTIGISYALGRIAIPEMMKSKYSPSLATGTVASVGTLGQLIPPSVMLVIYAGIAQTPVGPQLIAAMVPGIVLAVLFGIMITGWAVARPKDAPKADLQGISWSSRFRSLVKLVPVIFVVFVVIGGIFGGVFTPTEAGAFGALAAFVVAWITAGKGKRGIAYQLKFLFECVIETVASAAAIFLLISGVHVLTRLVTLSQLSQNLTEAVVSLGLDRTGLLLLMIVVYFILGMFLDPLAMMLLVIPVLGGTLVTLDVNMLWFGVFTVIMAEVAILSPPIGMLTFIVHKLAQDPLVNAGVKISLPTVFIGVLPFIACAVLLVVLMVFFPDIALWLPGISAAK